MSRRNLVTDRPRPSTNRSGRPEQRRRAETPRHGEENQTQHEGHEEHEDQFFFVSFVSFVWVFKSLSSPSLCLSVLVRALALIRLRNAPGLIPYPGNTLAAVFSSAP